MSFSIYSECERLHTETIKGWEKLAQYKNKIKNPITLLPKPLL